MEEARRNEQHAVIACSALKHAYRKVLIGDHSDVRLVYLQGTRKLIASRLTLRHGHFMPADLLDSQFAALEEPGEEERPIVISIDAAPQEVVHRILASLGMKSRAGIVPS
jgi:gluconokinase